MLFRLTFLRFLKMNYLQKSPPHKTRAFASARRQENS